jgi:imidazolonepropionase-like amidohydrolase
LQHSVFVNKAIFWFEVVLLPFLAANMLGAESARTPGSNAVSTPFLLNPARVFDTASGQTHAGWSVLVTNNQIAAVGPASAILAPPNTVGIPLADMTLLPGLMDIHSHIFLHPYNETSWTDQVMKEPVAYRTVEAAPIARSKLCCT